MFPAGRILWLLRPTGNADNGAAARAEPPAAAPRPQQQQQPAPLQLVQTDQSAFERFLFTTETATQHLPDFYAAAINALASTGAVTPPQQQQLVTPECRLLSPHTSSEPWPTL